jgi:hypothetical protein
MEYFKGWWNGENGKKLAEDEDGDKNEDENEDTVPYVCVPDIGSLPHGRLWFQKGSSR